jgi:hypothetical protein
LIDTTKPPFEIDHSKCLNCQTVPRLTKEEQDGNKFDGSTWQKGVHLCSSCQWHCAGLAQQIKTENVIHGELRSIEHSLYGECLPCEDIYFDQIQPFVGLKRLEALPQRYKNEVVLEAIKSLHQIVDELGFNKCRVVC